MKKDDLINLIARIMADLCGVDEAAHWHREADALIARALTKSGGDVLCLNFPDDLATLIDEWQGEWISKNSDFPLCGATG